VAHSNSKWDKAEGGIKTVSQKEGPSFPVIASEVKLERNQAEEEGRNRYVQNDDEHAREPGRYKSTGVHEVGKKKQEAVGDVREKSEHQFQS